jgi:hypothetical protein
MRMQIKSPIAVIVSAARCTFFSVSVEVVSSY